jgi:hypothetical protein
MMGAIRKRRIATSPFTSLDYEAVFRYFNLLSDDLVEPPRGVSLGDLHSPSTKDTCSQRAGLDAARPAGRRGVRRGDDGAV